MPETATKICLATVSLHNFLRVHEASSYCPPGFIDNDEEESVANGSWREEGEAGAILSLGKAGSNNYSRTAADIRDIYKNYFTSQEGRVSWQTAYVRRT